MSEQIRDRLKICERAFTFFARDLCCVSCEQTWNTAPYGVTDTAPNDISLKIVIVSDCIVYYFISIKKPCLNSLTSDSE